ncbi:HAD family hydrolase [Dermacoccaceae bacterium W4C1]
MDGLDTRLDTELLADDRFAPTPADAVVFDLGNVLIRWDPAPAVAAAVGEERAQRFLAEFDFTAWNIEQDRGRSFADGEAAAIRTHPQFEQEIRAYRPHFEQAMTGEIEDTVAVLKELHAAGVPLFALTNFSAELIGVALDKFDFLDLFEDIVVSGEEECIKPDPEIFEELESRVLHVAGLDDCIFIDDSEANVLAAQAHGMDAILFTDTGHLREDLRVRGMAVRAG